MARAKYALIAQYPLNAAYDYGYVVDVDLTQIVGRKLTSRTDLLGTRVLTWHFRTLIAAQNATRRLRRLRRLSGLKATVECAQPWLSVTRRGVS